MNRKDWALLVIASANGQPLTPVQLQKCMFLLGEERGDEIHTEYYSFTPYDYGPFSSEIYRDVEELEMEGLVSIQLNRNGRWKEYFATPEGVAQANSLRQYIAPGAVEYIDELVSWARRLSFQSLVKEIYRRYPAYRVNSIFRD